MTDRHLLTLDHQVMQSRRVKKLEAENSKLRARVSQLQIALIECAEAYENAALYKGVYLTAKHEEIRIASEYRKLAEG